MGFGGGLVGGLQRFCTRQPVESGVDAVEGLLLVLKGKQLSDSSQDCNLAELGEGPRPASVRGLVFESRPNAPPSALTPVSCSIATGGRGDPGHPAKDPWCAPGHHCHGAVGATHPGLGAGGRR